MKDYDYILPSGNLALEPADPRDSSKLFIYDTQTDKITFDRFFNLEKYLPIDSFLILNNTKVLPARVTLLRQGFGGQAGGKVIILFLVNELESLRVIRGIVDRKVKVGDKLFFNDGNYIKVVGQKENIFDFKFNFSREKLFALLKKYGTMPIPPYLKKSALTRDELLEKYQTIFYKNQPNQPGRLILGSTAAPTASLHFTDNVFKKLEKKGIEKYFITLHVGLGTFAPITDKNIRQKKLHEEYYEIDKSTAQSINRLCKEEKKLVAVGTTVARTLESAVVNFITRESLPRQEAGPLSKVKNFLPPPQNIFNKTDLFIFPPYDFKMVDILITNFHLPRSSLMMLVEAFLQYKKAKRSLVELYNIAIKNNFRFYSFGDAMMIL